MTEPIHEVLGVETTEDPAVAAGMSAELARRADDYSQLQGSLLMYALQSQKRMLHTGNLDWVLAGELPPDEELGAAEGDLGLDLTVGGHFNPLTRTHDYDLRLHHIRPDDAEPVEDEFAYYPGTPTAKDLMEFDRDTAESWCALLFAAVTQRKFKKREALARWSIDDTGPNAARASRSYEAAQLAVQTWRAAEDAGREPEA